MFTSDLRPFFFADMLDHEAVRPFLNDERQRGYSGLRATDILIGNIGREVHHMRAIPPAGERVPHLKPRMLRMVDQGMKKPGSVELRAQILRS